MTYLDTLPTYPISDRELADPMQLVMRPEYQANPYHAYDRFLADRSVVRSAEGIWYMYDYDNVIAGMKNTDLYTDVFRYSEKYSLPDDPFARFNSARLFNVDGPRHTELRGRAQGLFKPRYVRRLSGQLNADAEASVAKAIAKNGDAVDLVEDVLSRYTLRTVLSLLGIPAEDEELFSDWSVVFGKLNDGTLIFDPEFRESVVDTVAQLAEYLSPLLESRRANPSDDVLTSLACDESVTDEEIHGLIGGFIQAGSTSTAKQAGNTVLLLATEPGVADQLRKDPSLIPAAVEESYRVEPAIPLSTRIAMSDTTVGDHQIAKDDVLILFRAAANRDPKKFPQPAEFRLDRPPAIPNLTSGEGVHYCMGAVLSRQEIAAIVSALLDATSDFSLAVAPADVPRVPTWTERGPESLPLLLELKKS